MRAVAVLAVLPVYRRSFLEALSGSFDESTDELHFVTGDEHSDATVKSATFDGVTRVRNRHLAGRRLIWQRGAMKHVRKADVVVVDLNPRSLTAWTLLILGRVRRQRVLAWGHISPRLGAGAVTAPLRRAMRRAANGVISYTWSDAEVVRHEDRTAAVWVAANGLYPSRELGALDGRPRTRLLYVGRLEPPKKPLLLVEAFASAVASLPRDARLTFVGSGSLSEKVKQRSEELSISEQVDVLGQIDDFDSLKQLYAESIASVSPGYVGLSLTQSLGFGVPMIVADNEPHAPEVELLTDQTGAFFAADDPEALAATIRRVFSGESQWDPVHLVSRVRDTYSADAMADGFERALRAVPQTWTAS